MQDVSRGEGRTVLFVSHNMAAVRSLCHKGIVLKDGMMDFSGTTEEAIEHYLKKEVSHEKKLITDSIGKHKEYIEISNITINGTPFNSTSLYQGQQHLDVVIKGMTHEPMKCEVKLILKKLDDTPMASLVEGRYTGHLYEIPSGEFCIQKHIRLPRYMANGDYLVDLDLHQPTVQDFFQARNCMTIHIEGFYDQYALPLYLSQEGFLGLESE